MSVWTAANHTVFYETNISTYIIVGFLTLRWCIYYIVIICGIVTLVACVYC